MLVTTVVASNCYNIFMLISGVVLASFHCVCTAGGGGGGGGGKEFPNLEFLIQVKCYMNYTSLTIVLEPQCLVGSYYIASRAQLPP